MIKQLLNALHYMHSKDIIHRDLKMENVMVDVEESETGCPELVLKLTDFGFSCVIEPDKKPT